MKSYLHTTLLCIFILGCIPGVGAQELWKEAMAFSEVEHPPLPENCRGVSRQEAEQCLRKALIDHIREHFQYPQEAFVQEIQGKVIVDFEIDRSGRVANIQANGAHEILEKEAARNIGLLPPMNPGSHQGHPVAVKLSIPIPFKLVKAE